MKEKGLLAVANIKIAEAIASTKQTLDDVIDDQIIALHIKQNGIEPTPDPFEQRLICRQLIFDTIEVYLYR